MGKVTLVLPQNDVCIQGEMPSLDPEPLGDTQVRSLGLVRRERLRVDKGEAPFAYVSAVDSMVIACSLRWEVGEDRAFCIWGGAEVTSPLGGACACILYTLHGAQWDTPFLLPGVSEL